MGEGSTLPERRGPAVGEGSTLPKRRGPAVGEGSTHSGSATLDVGPGGILRSALARIGERARPAAGRPPPAAFRPPLSARRSPASGPPDTGPLPGHTSPVPPPVPPRSLLRVHVAGEAFERVRPLLAGAARVVWVGPGPEGSERVTGRGLRRMLGQTVDALVLDLRGERLELELLAVGEGLVRAGGRVVLVLDGDGPLAGRPPSLAVPPFGVGEVGRRAFDRLLAVAAEAGPAPPIGPAPETAGNADTERVAAALARRWSEPGPSTSVLLADRGRGKSSTLGLALARLPAGTRVAMSALEEDALVELRRFSGPGPVFVPPEELAVGAPRFDVVVVDEAAQIPVPLARRLAARHAGAHLAWASTARGYEGTGGGLLLRLLGWLRARGPLAEHRLTVPIRFPPDDPVERTVARLFAFDAEPAVPEDGPLTVATVSAADLAADEPLLRSVVALLGWAHHRTTPGDLVRLLDAPNLRLVVARQGGAVVGVNLVALEGGLDPAAAEAAARARLRGQGLADTLATHSGRPEAATFALRRSVRIATHPERRRAGIARALTEHVHATEPAELFGTLFGATAALIRFRRALGYEVARVGAARGARSGEPSVVMLRPVSARAAALLADLRSDLALHWPLQRVLLAREEPISEELAAAIEAGLPPAVEPDDAVLGERLAFYLGSAQPIEACVGFVAAFARRYPERLAALPPSDRALVAGRVLDLAGWPEVAARAGLTVEGAHRGMRRAVRALVG